MTATAERLTVADLVRQTSARPVAADLVHDVMTAHTAELADLHNALAAAGLVWIPGQGGQPGALVTVLREPADRWVVLDCCGVAWQRRGDSWEHGVHRMGFTGLGRDRGPLRVLGGPGQTR